MTIPILLSSSIALGLKNCKVISEPSPAVALTSTSEEFFNVNSVEVTVPPTNVLAGIPVPVTFWPFYILILASCVTVGLPLVTWQVVSVSQATEVDAL